ncbi:MAG: SbcC/MukB-like Walker B domain-containing protein [Planctomycetota bacterium]|nr:SbcC/MukB-like Walker B domain-containing protein [Planctomycetota bacterium]
MDHLFDIRPERPGYRLHRLELFNWGTFDSTSGHIYRFEPDGRTSLLVGCNGSGKSTLVDAILTLLVPSHIRNYNVAAGAKKTERNEKSYIRGAYGRSSDESQATVIKYLRPKGNNLSALLAVFRDEQINRAFTVCQVLYLSGDGSADKIFAIADEVRDLKHDLAGVKNSDKIRAHLHRMGYQTTKTFAEYDGWIVKRTGMRGKAMDMFNQTVAVKDIQSLNEFIRKHMLEAHDWREKVQRLLTHFNDLSVAHQELVRAQLAQELLTPVEKLGNSYREQSAAMESLERRLNAADTFFAVETVRLCEPELARRKDELSEVTATTKRLSRELKEAGETIRKLKNDIDLAGGQRLRDIPVLIEREEAFLSTIKVASERYHDQLHKCEIDDVADSEKTFAAHRQRLHSEVEITREAINTTSQQHEESLGRRGALSLQLRQEELELQILGQRQTNLASHFTTLRSRICEDLQLQESVLPFAAELMSVAAEDRRWEASIEMVLRSFALSLLVPDRLYPRVRAYVEQTKMANEKGEGQRLVYLRVGKAEADATSGDRLHPQSMFRKLKFRSGHDLVPWVRSEVLRRFDFRCCESIEQFNEVDRLGMTENRHVKFGTDRHEKDDRPRAVDPRHYVLGWDNREKRRLIAEHIGTLKTELEDLDQTIAAHATRLDRLRGRRDAAEAALEVSQFDLIDVRKHTEQIAELKREKTELESSNETVKTLRKTLKKVEKEETDLGIGRDAALKREQSLTEQIAREAALIGDARKVVAQAKADGTLDLHASEFPAIVDSLGDPPLAIETLFTHEQWWQEKTRKEVDRLRKAILPLGDKLVEAMARFLREFKEEQSDLSASVQALESFVRLLDHIRQEDLPRYEKQFKDRLNDKVSQEVALLNGALRQECKQIEGKIGQLNVALGSLEYQPGTFMRLEPREVYDRDIADFRRSLRECLDESLENTHEANEARFLRIKKLVERLADKENTRWRDKVIDVRYWFDFAAREVQKEDGKTRSFYEDSTGQSGGEKAKLAFTILVAAIAYQYDLDPSGRTPARFHFVVVDEMFSKVDDQNAQYALKLFQQFGLQLLIVAPLDAKARVTEPFVDSYLHSVKDNATNHSELYSMTAREYEEVLSGFPTNGETTRAHITAAK